MLLYIGVFSMKKDILTIQTNDYFHIQKNRLKKFHELSGVWCVIYLSASRCAEYKGSWIPKKCGLWVAGYPEYYTRWISQDIPYDIEPWEFAAIWQFTSSLIIPGFWEKLDGDIAYMDKEAWMKYAKSSLNPQKEDNYDKPEKSIDDLVLETLLGEYGDNEDRKHMLGDKYNEVQNRINKYYKIANEVIDGKWGNGWNRQNALNGAGYPYDIIQKIVNNIMDENKNITDNRRQNHLPSGNNACIIKKNEHDWPVISGALGTTEH